METAFVISAHVINTINSLPEKERVAVTSALAAELILGADADKCGTKLSPVEEMLYSMIKMYVRRDTERHRRMHSVMPVGGGTMCTAAAV